MIVVIEKKVVRNPLLFSKIEMGFLSSLFLYQVSCPEIALQNMNNKKAVKLW
jgi:hypothetical protein